MEEEALKHLAEHYSILMKPEEIVVAKNFHHSECVSPFGQGYVPLPQGHLSSCLDNPSHELQL